MQLSVVLGVAPSARKTAVLVMTNSCKYMHGDRCLSKRGSTDTKSRKSARTSVTIVVDGVGSWHHSSGRGQAALMTDMEAHVRVLKRWHMCVQNPTCCVIHASHMQVHRHKCLCPLHVLEVTPWEAPFQLGGGVNSSGLQSDARGRVSSLKETCLKPHSVCTQNCLAEKSEA